jgi:hypothetical protein
MEWLLTENKFAVIGKAWSLMQQNFAQANKVRLIEV